MKISLEFSQNAGVQVVLYVAPTLLRVITPLAGGALAWPWLIQIAQAMGWI